VSRTHIETGIYFRWEDPDVDNDSAASCSSSRTLNDARLGSYVYDEGDTTTADVSGTSCDVVGTSYDNAGTSPDIAGTSYGVAALQEPAAEAENLSTDGNNNDVSLASDDRRTSSSSQNIADTSPSQDTQAPVSSVLFVIII